MQRRLLVLPLLASLLILLGLSNPAGASGPNGLGFHAPVTMPGSTDGTEPFVAITNGGHRYTTWQSPGQFAGSSNGVTFTQLTTPDPDASGDTADEVDNTGALWNVQICGAPPFTLHSCVYRSVDGGHTWPVQTTFADNHPGASDRPWIDVYPKKPGVGSGDPNDTLVALEYHTFSPDDLVYVSISTDGGQSFSPPHIISSDAGALGDSYCNTIPSGVVIDQNNGNIYALWLSGNDPIHNLGSGCNYSQLGPFDKAWVSVSKDQGTTWTSSLAWDGSADYDAITNIGPNADKIFGTITVDKAGQVHVMLPVRQHDDPVGYTGDCVANPSTCQEDPQPTDLLFMTSPDHSATWTKPVTLRCMRSHFFPWIAGGSKGRVAAVLYASESLRPNDPTSVWYIWFLQITNAVAKRDGTGTHYISPPTFQATKLDRNPVHTGGICSFGIFCAAVPNANRNLADSISVAIDPAGAANAIWTNDQGLAPSSRIDFACQSSGPSFYAGKPNLTGCYVEH